MFNGMKTQRQLQEYESGKEREGMEGGWCDEGFNRWVTVFL